MTRLALALMAALVIGVPAGSARAGDYDYLRDDGSVRYRFYTDLELLYVERARTRDVEIGYSDPAGTGFLPGPLFQEALSTDAVVDNDEEFGGRGLFGFRLSPTQAVEGAFMGWGHDRSESVTDPGNLFALEFPQFEPGLRFFMATPISRDQSFNEADTFELDYDSQFYSGELNYRHVWEVEGVDYRFNLLAGVRYLRLDESVDLTALGTNSFGPFSGPSLGIYDIDTQNDMYGGQIGVETFVPLYGDWLEGDIYLALGAYGRKAQGDVFFYSNNLSDVPGAPAVGTPFESFASEEHYEEWDIAGVLEAAAHIKIRLWRGIRLNLGYRAVYLMNVAAASDQFAGSGSSDDFFGFDTDSKSVFHGPSVQLSADF